MVHEFKDGWSVLAIQGTAAVDNVNDILIEVVRVDKVRVLDLLDQFFVCAVTPWESACGHGVEDNTEGPDITGASVMDGAIVADEFWGHVKECSASAAVEVLTIHGDTAEICKFEVESFVEEEVVWLNVAVRHVSCVEILENEEHFTEESACSLGT